MAITTATVATTSVGTIYTSTVASAITFMSLCNYGATDVLVDIHIVPNGVAAGTGNILIKDLEIIAGDTYILYQGGEKVILGTNDFVAVKSSVANTVTVITSFAAI